MKIQKNRSDDFNCNLMAQLEKRIISAASNAFWPRTKLRDTHFSNRPQII